MTMNEPFVPHDLLDSRRRIWTQTLGPNMDQAIEMIRTSYPRRAALDSAFEFVDWDLNETVRGDVELLNKLGFVPWVEASEELHNALTCILIAQHRYAADSMRRALELTVTGLFLGAEDVSTEDAHAWMEGVDGTPQFSRAMKHLSKLEPFACASAACGWHDYVCQLYWDLCDVIHVRGHKRMARYVQPWSVNTNGIAVPKFSADHVTGSLNTLLEIISAIALSLGIANPIVFRGVPLSEKFGLNPPMRGFVEDVTAERIRGLLPARFLPFVENLVATDPEVASLVRWFESQPDITDEELRAQAEAFRASIGRPHGA